MIWRFAGIQTNVPSATVQTTAGISIGAPAARRMIVGTGAGVIGTATNLVSLVITPNIGTAKTATKIATTGTDPGMALFQCVLDADANAARTISVTSNFGVDPAGNGKIVVWTIPSGELASTTATGTLQAAVTGNTTVSGTLNVTAGGFIIAGAYNTGSGQTAVISGASAFVERYDNGVTFNAVAADAFNAGRSATSTVQAVFSSSGNPRIVAAAWK